MDKNGLIGMIIVGGVLLVLGFFWFVGAPNGHDPAGPEWKSEEEDVKCIKVQTTCCPCNMGGQEKCVLESEVEKYEMNLSECSENLVCIALYACQIESCEYIEGGCVAK